MKSVHGTLFHFFQRHVPDDKEHEGGRQGLLLQEFNAQAGEQDGTRRLDIPDRNFLAGSWAEKSGKVLTKSGCEKSTLFHFFTFFTFSYIPPEKCEKSGSILTKSSLKIKHNL